MASRSWAQQFNSISSRLRWLQNNAFTTKNEHGDDEFKELYDLITQVKDKALEIYGPKIASEMYWNTEPK